MANRIATGMSQTKVCEFCCSPFSRPRNYSLGQWEARRFCSLQCSANGKENHSNTMDDFWRFIFPEPNSGCWLWDGTLHHDGYGQIRIDGVVHRAHRLSYEIHCGGIPDGLGALHKCDVRCCVNPDHIYAGTDKDNSRDKVRRGRTLIGEQNASAKLTSEIVQFLRRSDETDTELAKRFGVSRPAVRNARCGKTWRHI